MYSFETASQLLCLFSPLQFLIGVSWNYDMDQLFFINELLMFISCSWDMISPRLRFLCGTAEWDRAWRNLTSRASSVCIQQPRKFWASDSMTSRRRAGWGFCRWIVDASCYCNVTFDQVCCRFAASTVFSSWVVVCLSCVEDDLKRCCWRGSDCCLTDMTVNLLGT